MNRGRSCSRYMEMYVIEISDALDIPHMAVLVFAAVLWIQENGRTDTGMSFYEPMRPHPVY